MKKFLALVFACTVFVPLSAEADSTYVFFVMAKNPTMQVVN